MRNMKIKLFLFIPTLLFFSIFLFQPHYEVNLAAHIRLNIFSKDNNISSSTRNCPLGIRSEISATGESFNSFSDTCFDILRGTATPHNIETAENVSKHRYFRSNNESLTFASCDDYFSQHCYYNRRLPVTDWEENFPLAFGILIYKHFEQFEQLLRMMYRPYNFYCIHVDEGAQLNFKAKVIKVQIQHYLALWF